MTPNRMAKGTSSSTMDGLCSRVMTKMSAVVTSLARPPTVREISTKFTSMIMALITPTAPAMPPRAWVST